MIVKKTIAIDEDLYNRAKTQAVIEKIDLITENGWIASAIQDKLESTPKDFYNTSAFKTQAISRVKELLKAGDLTVKDLI